MGDRGRSGEGNLRLRVSHNQAPFEFGETRDNGKDHLAMERCVGTLTPTVCSVQADEGRRRAG
jgi:hypothetical protein